MSTVRQANVGMSLESQCELAKKMVSQYHPSKVYWFTDAGKSAKSDESFDKLKVNTIRILKAEHKISELWVFDISRIGRASKSLIYFYLDFCGSGGTIRTPEGKCYESDLTSMVTYVIEAHSAEKANKDRAAASRASKAQFFKSGKWNRPIPFGYFISNTSIGNASKGAWLKKDECKRNLIQDVFASFITNKNLTEVVKTVRQKYPSETISFTREKIKRILTDPIMIGKPSFLGVVVDDKSLAFVDEGDFMSVAKILEKSKCKCTPKWSKGIVAKMAIESPTDLLTILMKKVNLTCKSCGGKVDWNGSVHDGDIEQERLICKKCGMQCRIPTHAQLNHLREYASPLLKVDHTDPLILREKSKTARQQARLHKKNQLAKIRGQKSLE